MGTIVGAAEGAFLARYRVVGDHAREGRDGQQGRHGRRFEEIARRSIPLLEPIHDAQFASIRQGRIEAVD
jgi:hypothetical protein